MNIQQILLQELHQQATQKGHNPSELLGGHRSYNHGRSRTHFQVVGVIQADAVGTFCYTIHISVHLESHMFFDSVTIHKWPDDDKVLGLTTRIPLEDPQLFTKIWEFIEK